MHSKQLCNIRIRNISCGRQRLPIIQKQSYNLLGGQPVDLQGGFVIQKRTFRTSSVTFKDEQSDAAGFQPIQPDYDWDYICDPANTEDIKQNITNRKGVGDIDKLVRF